MQQQEEGNTGSSDTQKPDDGDAGNAGSGDTQKPDDGNTGNAGNQGSSTQTPANGNAGNNHSRCGSAGRNAGSDPDIRSGSDCYSEEAFQISSEKQKSDVS